MVAILLNPLHQCVVRLTQCVERALVHDNRHRLDGRQIVDFHARVAAARRRVHRLAHFGIHVALFVLGVVVQREAGSGRLDALLFEERIRLLP